MTERIAPDQAIESENLKSVEAELNEILDSATQFQEKLSRDFEAVNINGIQTPAYAEELKKITDGFDSSRTEISLKLRSLDSRVKSFVQKDQNPDDQPLAGYTISVLKQMRNSFEGSNSVNKFRPNNPVNESQQQAFRSPTDKERFQNKLRVLHSFLHDVAAPLAVVSGRIDLMQMYEDEFNDVSSWEGIKRAFKKAARLNSNFILKEGRLVIEENSYAELVAGLEVMRTEIEQTYAKDRNSEKEAYIPDSESEYLNVTITIDNQLGEEGLGQYATQLNLKVLQRLMDNMMQNAQRAYISLGIRGVDRKTQAIKVILNPEFIVIDFDDQGAGFPIEDNLQTIESFDGTKIESFKPGQGKTNWEVADSIPSNVNEGDSEITPQEGSAVKGHGDGLFGLKKDIEIDLEGTFLTGTRIINGERRGARIEVKVPAGSVKS